MAQWRRPRRNINHLQSASESSDRLDKPLVSGAAAAVSAGDKLKDREYQQQRPLLHLSFRSGMQPIIFPAAAWHNAEINARAVVMFF